MIRALAREEMPFIFELAAAEGWNSRRYDAAPFFAADPNGFFVAEADTGFAGCIAAVRYKTFGFIGMFIVRAELRGKGIGTSLFKHALAYLDDLPIGLDAVLEQEPRYEGFGFRRAYTNVRYRAGEILPREHHASGVRIERLRVLDDDVIEYDRRCFGSARPEFLQSWVAQPDVVARAARSLHDGTILGYGVGREARTGTKIGPLFASRLDVASLLFDVDRKSVV